MTKVEFMKGYLSEPELLRFEHNLNASALLGGVSLDYVGTKPRSIITFSFPWSRTPEGKMYWQEIYDRL